MIDLQSFDIWVLSEFMEQGFHGEYEIQGGQGATLSSTFGDGEGVRLP